MLMSHSLSVMKSLLSMWRPSRLNLTSEMLEMISEKKVRAAYNTLSFLRMGLQDTHC